MSCKSAIYTANETVTSGIASGSVLPLGNIVRRFGQNINLSGNGILLSGQGYYEVNVSASITPSAADTVTVQLYKDGVAVPGAKASGLSSGSINTSFPALIRIPCCAASSVLTLVAKANGANTTLTVNSIATVVEKI